MILAIDASTYAATVALLDGRRLILEREVAMRDPHTERLMPAVALTLEEARVGTSGVQRLVCGAGPGRFTSLRIAASIAKGMAMGLGVPLYAAPSLALIVAASETLAAGTYLACLDALRGELYASLFHRGSDGEVSPAGEPRLIPALSRDDLARELGAQVIGPGCPIEAAPHARGVSRLQGMITESGPVPIATWEPLYGRLAEAQ